jgi:colicin import membrane protein
MTADRAARVAAGLPALAVMLLCAAVQAASPAAPMQAYVEAVHAAIMRNWVQPPSTRPDLHCPLSIDQVDGGAVVQVSFGDDCNADAATRDALDRAVRKASPLPYAGFERVFQRRIHLVFKHSGH